MRTSKAVLAVAVLVGTLIFNLSAEAKGPRDHVDKGVRWCDQPDLVSIIEQDATGEEYGWLANAGVCGTFTQWYRVRASYVPTRTITDPVTGIPRSLFRVYLYGSNGKQRAESHPFYIAREDDVS